MIEITVKQYLDEQLEVEVYAAVPPKHGDVYVTVEKTGGSYDHGMKTATLAIQSHAKTIYDAMQLNERVIRAMLLGLVKQDLISRVELNATYNYTDDRKPRYQAVFDVVYFE